MKFRGYREFKRLACMNAAEMVSSADLDSLYGDDVQDEEMEAAEKAQRDVAALIRRRAQGKTESEVAK